MNRLSRISCGVCKNAGAGFPNGHFGHQVAGMLVGGTMNGGCGLLHGDVMGHSRGRLCHKNGDGSKDTAQAKTWTPNMGNDHDPATAQDLGTRPPLLEDSSRGRDRPCGRPLAQIRT